MPKPTPVPNIRSLEAHSILQSMISKLCNKKRSSKELRNHALRFSRSGSKSTDLQKVHIKAALSDLRSYDKERFLRNDKRPRLDSLYWNSKVIEIRRCDMSLLVCTAQEIGYY